jgi:type I restriction enzyme S subunit
MRDGWVKATLKQALDPIANRPNGKDYPLVLSVTEKRGIIPQTEIFKHRIATDDISKYKVIEPLDIAYNPYLLWCGAIGQWKGTEPGVVSPVYECFRVKNNCSPKFLGFIFEAGILTEYFNSRAIGSIVRRRRTIPADFIGAPILLPPLAEQKRIVDLISSVDSYIEALQQQVGKARKSRNAVLHELLTKGGDGWVETTLGEVTTIINGGTPSTKNADYWGGEIVWITTTELTASDGKRVNSSKRTITQDGLNSGPARMVRAGTTLVGTTATIGTCAIAACDLTFNQQISGLLPKTNKIDDGFLFYWIQFAKPIFEGLAAGTSFKRISTSVLKTVEIKFPPLPEQKRIIEIISVFDNQIEALYSAISKTKNLRSALLSDLLSGNHEIPSTYDKLIGAA